MQVAYITRKLFADDSEEIRIKLNRPITANSKLNARHTRKINKNFQEFRNSYLRNEILKIPFYDPQYKCKIKRIQNELQLRNIQNIYRSASRSRQVLYDICKCNEFKFFVTFTYDPEKIDRHNDNKVKRKFTEWANNTRKLFPNMYYIAVPEYHNKGALHFHLLIGGVTFDELKCVPARTKRGRLKFKHGKQIFNVTAWKWGFSTLSIVENEEASKHYICKYITKQHCDDRFFNKRRYYASHNIRRPLIEKQCVMPEHCLDGIDDNVYIVEYLDEKKQYAVLSRNGDGIVNETMNAPEVKEDLQRLRAGASGGGLSTPPRGARVRYSTVRTLNSNDNRAIDWQYEKNRMQRRIFKTLRERILPHEDYKPMQYEEQCILDEMYANMHVIPCHNAKRDIELCREIGLID